MSDKINSLLEVMAALRTPLTGCPWDLEQNFKTIAPYTLEEAYEVVDAIERHDLNDLKDELGDLLLQVVFHARMAEELGQFRFDDVVTAISDKLIRRHPHVFGDVDQLSAPDVLLQWDEIKAQEKLAKNPAPADSVLDGVPLALPALTRAVKIQKKAAKVGFDWDDVRHVLDKIREETEEVAVELEPQRSQQSDKIQEEIGDLLFAVSNLARHQNIDPEQALRGATDKFERRFHYIEKRLRETNVALSEASLADMERLWQEAKKYESPPLKTQK